MYRVMLSYPLFGSGMRRLEQETDLFVTGCGELAPYEAQFCRRMPSSPETFIRTRH